MNKKYVIDKILPVLLIVAAVFLITNVALLQARTEKWQTAQEDIKEQLRPAELQLTILAADECNECADIESAITQLKSLNANITGKKTVAGSSAAGKELIAKHGIKKLPTFIISGETNKSPKLANYFSSNGEVADEQFIYSAGKAPYYDIAAQQVVGLVSIISLSDSTCPDCADLSSIPQALEEQGVRVKEITELDYKTSKGKEFASLNGIGRVPALIISSEIDAYPDVAGQLASAGFTLENDHYLFQAPVPVYRDLATDEIVGLVELVMLTDNSCSECYDVAVNKQILQRFGLVIKNENTHDISSPQGVALKEKYDVEKVPVIILSPDASAYPSLMQAWKSVGSVEDDGWLVMRKPELIGTYKDLSTNQVVDPQQGQ